MIITHKINMDLARPWIIPPVSVMQDDKYSRNLELTLTENGTAWAIPDDVDAIVRFIKSDGTGGNYDALPDGDDAYRIDGNVLTIALAPEVCTAPGLVRLAVGLKKGHRQLHTFDVELHVKKNPGLNTSSNNYFKIAGAVADAGWAPGMILATDANGNVVAMKNPGDMAVQYVAQPLTEKQQMQARQNMGLYGDVDVEIGETLFWDGDAAGKDVADKWDGGQTILLSEGVIEDAMYTGTLNMDGEAMEVSIIQDADMPRVHAILDEEGHEYGFIAEMGILALLYYKGAEVRKSGLYVHTDMIPGGAIITIPGYAFVEKVPVQMPEKYIPRTVPIVGSAMVGQAVAVKAVDENGVPIAWKVVDFPVSGGGGLNITDDGNGNVTIASTGSVTITDDGEGNVTIA